LSCSWAMRSTNASRDPLTSSPCIGLHVLLIGEPHQLGDFRGVYQDLGEGGLSFVDLVASAVNCASSSST
jgi:hypothetical protein